MRQKIAVFDIDGTLFRGQLDHAVMLELENMGAIRGFKQALHEPYTDWKNREHLEAFKKYESIFDEATARHLKTVSLTTYNQAVQNVINQVGRHVYAYTRHTVAKLKAQGYAIVAISGSLQEVVGPFARAHGFDTWQGQTLGVEDDYFVNTYGSFLPGQKAAYLHELIEKHGYTIKGSIGMGDTLGDAGLLEAVENPIAFNPNQQLMRHAMQKNWKIVIERKNVVYELTARDGNYGLEQPLLLNTQ